MLHVFECARLPLFSGVEPLLLSVSCDKCEIGRVGPCDPLGARSSESLSAGSSFLPSSGVPVHFSCSQSVSQAGRQ